jgi:hypothetical protein
MTPIPATPIPAISPPSAHFARDCAYVQTALRRIKAMRSSKGDFLEPPNSSELENALGRKVQKCELRAENWRHRVYRIELEDGSAAVAKQLVMGSQGMLQYQFAQLQELAMLNIPGLRVPRALALLPEKRVLVMEFAHGKSIEALAWTSSDVLEACDLAGKILARIQLARTESISPVPVELVAADLRQAPWRLTRREDEILRRTLEDLSKARARIGQVYYDYKPANLLLHEKRLSLVDPPDTLWRGVHLWDFACFYSSLRRHGWRITFRRPFDRRRRTIIRQGLTAFERAYRTSFTEHYPEPGFFTLAVRLFELQRNAVLMTMQNAKVRLMQERAPIARRKRLGNPLANRMTLPLLEIEKRWLFRQLERELS